MRPDGDGGVEVTKRVLAAVAQVLPDDGQNHLPKLEIWQGWGHILSIRLYTTMSQSTAGREFAAKLREAIAEALGNQRHTVEIVWDAQG